MNDRSSPDSATQERLLRELTASGEPVLCFQAAQEIHRLQQLVDTRASLQPATPTAGWTEGDVALFAARMRGIGLMKPQGYGQIEHDLVRKLLQEFPRLASATGGDAVAGEALRKAAKRAVKLFNTPNNDGLYDAMNDLKAALRSPDAAATPSEPVAWRWRAVSWDNHWIYAPSQEWRELRQSDPELEFQPLYATPQPLNAAQAPSNPATGAGSNIQELLARAETYLNINAADGRGSALLVMELADALRASSISSTEPLPPADLYAWPVGCKHPNSCHRHDECMYRGCVHQGKKAIRTACSSTEGR